MLTTVQCIGIYTISEISLFCSVCYDSAWPYFYPPVSNKSPHDLFLLPRVVAPLSSPTSEPQCFPVPCTCLAPRAALQYHLPPLPAKSHVPQPTAQISERAAHQQIFCLPRATKQQNISHSSQWALDPILLLNSVALSRQKSSRETSMSREHTCTDAHSNPERNIQMSMSRII